MLIRIQDYFTMGVPEVWIFDPQQRQVTICTPDGLTTELSSGQLGLAGTPIVIDIAEVFSALDEDYVLRGLSWLPELVDSAVQEW